MQVELTIMLYGKGILDAHFPVTQGFDLGASQYDSGLDRVEDLVIVSGLAVGGQHGIGIGRGHNMKKRRVHLAPAYWNEW